LKQSIKDIFKRHGWRLDRALHNFVYFYFYKTYVKSATILTRATVALFGWLKPLKIIPNFVFNRYHSKIISTEDVTKILSLEEDIDLGRDRNRRVIPFKYANRILFKNPKYIAVMDCPCVLNQKEPRCEPLNKCISIGRDFAPLWIENCEKKYNARQITQQEALDIIEKSRETGHVTNAFFKVATGGITGVICSCCPKCCVEFKATLLSQKFDKNIKQYSESGYSVNYDSSKCTLCGKCAEICPFKAVSIKNGAYLYDIKACMGCGLCVEHCPESALDLYRDPDKLLPLDIELLKNEMGSPT
jgi:NAD-dependent dihydropyrimidine dehydrogenase PreA subunit